MRESIEKLLKTANQALRARLSNPFRLLTLVLAAQVAMARAAAMSNQSYDTGLQLFGPDGWSADSVAFTDSARGANGNIYFMGEAANVNRSNIFFGEFDAEGLPEWVRNLSVGGGEATGKSLNPTADGYFIMAGSYVGTNSTDMQPFLAKVDGHGEPQWQFISEGTGSAAVNMAKQTHNGGFIAVGLCDHSANGHSNIYVAKHRGDGSLAWCKGFGIAEFDEALDVCVASDGTYLVTGWSRQLRQADKLFVMRITGEGEVDWTIQIAGPQHSQGYRIVETAARTFNIFGYSDIGIGIENGRDMLVACVDSTGVVQQYTTIGAPGFNAIYGVEAIPKGGYFLTGHVDNGEENQGDVVVVRIEGADAQFELNWGKAVDIDDMSTSGVNLHLLEDGNVKVIGSATEITVPVGQSRGLSITYAGDMQVANCTDVVDITDAMVQTNVQIQQGDGGNSVNTSQPYIAVTNVTVTERVLDHNTSSIDLDAEDYRLAEQSICNGSVVGTPGFPLSPTVMPISIGSPTPQQTEPTNRPIASQAPAVTNPPTVSSSPPPAPTEQSNGLPGAVGAAIGVGAAAAAALGLFGIWKRCRHSDYEEIKDGDVELGKLGA